MPDISGQGYITVRLPYEDRVAIQIGIEKWSGRSRDDIEILADVTVVARG
ncbi:hypothetical protein [Leifsonia sp. Root227]|nr:hypothetical protein [Leifsonia sp. Root227]